MMDSELALVVGLVVAVLAVPGGLSAYSDGRAPRAAAIAILVGGGLALYGITQHPEGLSFSDLPHVFVRVIARYI